MCLGRVRVKGKAVEGMVRMGGSWPGGDEEEDVLVVGRRRRGVVRRGVRGVGGEERRILNWERR